VAYASGGRTGSGEGSLPAPTVAVVIPCYNYARFLPEAVQSVMAQTHPAQTVLVVDDGSTDDTESVVRELGSGVDYLKVRHGGPSAARNAGARAVDTDLVVYLDADDCLEPTFLQRCIAVLPEDWSSHFVYTHLRRFGTSQELVNAHPYDRSRLIRDNYIHSGALLPRSHVVNLAYDEALKSGLEDWDLYLTFAERGITGILVEEPLFRYRQHGDGLTWRLRRRPVHLALLRLRLMSKHRCLYGQSDRARQVVTILSLLLVDTEERYQVRRRSRRLSETVVSQARQLGRK
jgi:glycosyltransferase involved in cell wall biosynthesis